MASLPKFSVNFHRSNQIRPNFSARQVRIGKCKGPGELQSVFWFGQDLATLDLVAHMLGIATHDNINAAPSGTAHVGGRPRMAVAQACHALVPLTFLPDLWHDGFGGVPAQAAVARARLPAVLVN